MKKIIFNRCLKTSVLGAGLLLGGVAFAAATPGCNISNSEEGNYCNIGAMLTDGHLSYGALIYNGVPVACTSNMTGNWVNTSGNTYLCKSKGVGAARN